MRTRYLWRQTDLQSLINLELKPCETLRPLRLQLQWMQSDRAVSGQRLSHGFLVPGAHTNFEVYSFSAGLRIRVSERQSVMHKTSAGRTINEPDVMPNTA